MKDRLTPHCFTLFAATTLLTTAARADITFTFDGNDNGTNTIVKTIGGVTLTLSSASSSSGFFAADSDGLLLSNNPDLGPSSWRFSFDQPVQLLSYHVGFVAEDTAGSFDLNDINRDSPISIVNGLSTVGSFNFDQSPLFLDALQEIELSAEQFGSPAFQQIDQFVIADVPEPGVTAILGLGACALVGVRRFKKG